MIDKIKAVEGYENMVPAAISVALQQRVPKPNSFYTFNSLVIALDNDVQLVEQLVGAMRAAGLNASADSLTNRGIDFGLLSVPVMLDSLGQAAPEIFTEGVVATLKALGQETRWKSLGGEGDPPDAAQVQTALDGEARRVIRETAVATVQSKANAMSSWLNTAQALAMSPADYQVYADSLLATEDGNPPGGG